MRITKKLLRETKGLMGRRVNELCAMGVKGKIADEYFRCFPAAVGSVPADHTDWHKARELFSDLLERALPDHWCH